MSGKSSTSRPSRAQLPAWRSTALAVVALACGPAIACAEPSAEDGVRYSAHRWVAEDIEVEPYLLDLQPHSASLGWVTPRPRAAVIELRSAEGSRRFREPTPTRYHRLDLGDLRPNRLYRYEIDRLYLGSFSTPVAGSEFHAAVLGHTHGSETMSHYPDELLTGRLRDLAPEIILHCGDATYHPTDADFARYFFALFRPLSARIPVFVAPGNHDVGFPDRTGTNLDSFRRLFPRRYGGRHGAYSFVHKGVRFLALSYITLGKGESEQIRWLRKELASSQERLNVVFLGGANFPEANLDYLFSVMAEYRVELAFGGDGSGVDDRTLHGIPYFFTGTGNSAPHNFRWLNFRDYFVTVQRFDALGRPLDRARAIGTRVEPIVVEDLLREGRTTSTGEGPRRLDFGRPQDHGSRISARAVALPIEAVDGVRVLARGVGEGRGHLRLFWQPEETRVPFELQSIEVTGGESQDLVFALPRVDPMSGKAYELESVELVAEWGPAGLAAEIDAFALVRMPVAESAKR